MKGRFNFFGIIPLIAQLFVRKGNEAAVYSNEPNHQAPLYSMGSHSHYGSSGMNFHEILQARRKIHRAKMYKQFRGCRLRGQRVKSYR